MPWFPRRPKDIDHFSQTTLDAGQELEADHPGFNVRIKPVWYFF